MKILTIIDLGVKLEDGRLVHFLEVHTDNKRKLRVEGKLTGVFRTLVEQHLGRELTSQELKDGWDVESAGIKVDGVLSIR